jgi:hypothetical protein
MRYLRVVWHHDFDDEPVELYSKLDDEGYEVRKVEIYRNGLRNYADSVKSTGQTELGEIPVPSIEEIAEQEEFSPTWIGPAQFEEAWRLAVRER